MKRREFITLLGGAASWPLGARAQQPGKLPTIGYLGAGTSASESQRVAAFKERLHQLGWIEGRTIAIESRWVDTAVIAVVMIPPVARAPRAATRPRRREAI